MNALEELAAAGELTEEIEKRIAREYGIRGRKAIEAVKAGRVKKYRDFFVVEGKGDRYVIEGDFCTCRDYLYRLSKNGGLCYHSLAVRIAAFTGQYEQVDEWYSDHILQREYGESHS
ncbi:MAG: SWIM zinc finger family protein [Methanocella sp.]